jgi:RNA polymerase sigma-70 factor, ECF subfamily
VALERQSDEALMEAFQKGDVHSFEELLTRHRKPVMNFLYRQVGNEALAEDLLQEVFLRIIQGGPTYKAQAKFTTWLYTIARNLCVDNARRAKHRKARSLDQPVGEDGKGTMGDFVPDKGAGPDRQAIGRQLQGRIAEAIETLPEDQREVFLLREYLNLPFKEIADIVGCPENTVKSRMRYALERLRQELDEYRDLAMAVH